MLFEGELRMLNNQIMWNLFTYSSFISREITLEGLFWSKHTFALYYYDL